MISNQEIWKGQIEIDPNSFKEKFSNLKDKAPSKNSNSNRKALGNFPKKSTLNSLKPTAQPSSQTKPQKQQPIKKPIQTTTNEDFDYVDYVEDEMDESVQVPRLRNIPTFNQITPHYGRSLTEASTPDTPTQTQPQPQPQQTPQVIPQQSKTKKSTAKQDSTSKHRKNQVKPNQPNTISAFQQNQAPQNATMYNQQMYQQNMTNMNNPPNANMINPNMNYPTNTTPIQSTQNPNEINFININIAPNNGRFTQNIYMNFPPGAQQQQLQPNPVMMQQPPQQYQPYNPSLMQQPMNNNQMNVTNNKINLVNIIIGSDKRTTLMLRNIPNKYTLNNIVDEIGNAFWGKYDCINLPIDYETKLNLGYAFINFTDPLHIIHFFTHFHLKKWTRYKSEKKMDMTYADKQGKKDITLKAENNYFPQDDKRFDFKTIKPCVEIPCVSYNIYVNVYVV